MDATPRSCPAAARQLLRVDAHVTDAPVVSSVPKKNCRHHVTAKWRPNWNHPACTPPAPAPHRHHRHHGSYFYGPRKQLSYEEIKGWQQVPLDFVCERINLVTGSHMWDSHKDTERAAPTIKPSRWVFFQELIEFRARNWTGSGLFMAQATGIDFASVGIDEHKEWEERRKM